MKNGKFKKILIYGGLEQEDYELIQPELTKLNQTNLRILSLITSLYMLVMLATSYQNSISSANRVYYIACLGVSLLAFAISSSKLLKRKMAAMLAVYLYLGALFCYGIAIGCTQTDQTSVSFLIFIMVGPLLFYDRPYHMNTFIWIFDLIFLMISLKIKTPRAGETDLINGISYGIISNMLSTRSMMIRMERVLFGKKMGMIAELDCLTNLKNRNCFERHYHEYENRIQRSIACIYVDANGLHELNNLQGHEAGDRMLKYLADEIARIFGREDVYRVGGDEYMVFCCDEACDDINRKLEELSGRMEEKQYSVSIGVASAPAEELKLEELIKSADEQMYSAKKEYYAKKGIAWRKQYKKTI